MKHPILVVGLIAILASPSVAQQGPAPGYAGSPSPDVLRLAQKVRDAARTQALAALSTDHQAKINAVLGAVKSGQITELRDAAKQIDAILDPKESQAVLAARDEMLADVRNAFGAPDGGPPPGEGPPPDGPPGGKFGGPPDGGGARDGMRAMHHDAGVALLTLGLDRAQLRSLMGNRRPPH